ncbi:MAG: glycoside hydrolase domain-containing protein [Nocardioidaceae bacterium]
MTVGDVWYDFSTARPTVAQLKAAGVEGVLRYLSPLNSDGSYYGPTAPKMITKQEFDSYITAGIDVVCNWEWYEGRCLEGAPAGAQDGSWAAHLCHQIGYAPGATIFFSHDTAEGDNTTVGRYLIAAQQAIEAAGYSFVADVYGGSGFVNAQLQDRRSPVKYGWQTSAWSGGQYHGVAALYQDLAGAHGSPQIGGCDLNIVMKEPFGSHLQTLGGQIGDWFDMATQADLENAVRKVLNEGTAPGQPSWAGTSKATLGTVQGLTNQLAEADRGSAGRVNAILYGDGRDVPVGQDTHPWNLKVIRQLILDLQAAVDAIREKG